MQHASSAGARPGRLEAALGILNGLIGDYLDARSNPLATRFGLYEENRPLPCDRDALARAHPAADGRLCVLVHGLAMNEGVWSRWRSATSSSSGTAWVASSCAARARSRASPGSGG